MIVAHSTIQILDGHAIGFEICSTEKRLLACKLTPELGGNSLLS